MYLSMVAGRLFAVKVLDRVGEPILQLPRANLAQVVKVVTKWQGKAIVHVTPPLGDWERVHVAREASRG